jgi:hypothetical protein
MSELYSYVVDQMQTANFAPCRVALREAGGGTLGDYLTSQEFVDYCITKIPHVEWTPQVNTLVTNMATVVEDKLDLNIMRAMATNKTIPTSAIYWGACHVAWEQIDRYVR